MKNKSKTIRLFREIWKVIAPPPQLTVSEWADQYRYLSREDSAEPGKWRTSRAPYQREMMDAVNDLYVETVVFMTSAQVGKTAILSNIVGYHVHQDPAPMLFVQPTLEISESLSKDRLAPMFRDTPVLRDKVMNPRRRDSGNTLLHKRFPGGQITLAGANSPASLAGRSVRIVLLDEVDRYPISAGTEGDPVALASKRTTTFWNRKRVLVSTPTIKGASRIEFAYSESTMEQWCLPCPQCGEHQPLQWANIRFEDASHRCEDCGFHSDEQKWKGGEGRWIARQESKVRGFHLNALSSPWVRWSELIAEFREAKNGGTEMLKTFINTVLGETWEEEAEKLEEESLLKRCEGYPAEVPDEVRVLTAAVDVQDDRFEIEVVGWGAGKESWGIQYHVIYGDLRQPKIWNELDQFLLHTWKNKAGQRFGIAITCVDTGGHYTTEVYRFCAAREARKVYAIKGQGTQNGGYVPLINNHKRTPREKAILFNLGVDEGKAKVFSSLKIAEVGAGFCHFPLGRGYNFEYFRGLTAEVLEIKKRMGVAHRVWKQIRDRNEPLDLRVYNTAALEILNPNLDVPLTGTPNVKTKRRRRIISKGIT